jgi:predicted metal-binding membrane protein
MMFPTAAPMILTFHQVQAGKQGRGETFVSTWVFVAGYMAVWVGMGVLAFAGAAVAEMLDRHVGLSAATTARIGGALLVVAGAYQLSPLKDLCLAKCRTPIGFILTSWRDGRWGAVRMGLEHGAFCLGCCWLLFLALFPLGIMNIAAMAVVTLLIFAEKTFRSGEGIAKLSGVALLLYGAAVLVFPQALPTFQAMDGMMMN